ncbi:MAG TPA: glycosyltransferase [Intrasporangium sp.]|uniref:glycosyltransferase n=1 Tax=Intrasporangium sp. TaxID=1925024 RepID=UPI002D7768B6|nr:glycosyltransferase [Intrasporangium sp.]HET7399677.1 glycosyltransferase [Intrasporangium sp.]
MRILLWHVHGSWATAFVQGQHDYLVPVLPDRGADGLGRARSWDWPASVSEVTPQQLRDAEVDVVVLQRPHEVGLAAEWTGRRPGRDVPAVYVEHNTPRGDVPATRHPLADQGEIPIVHVTHFNRLFWDCGTAPTHVIEHGVVDPGHRYSGEWPRAAVVVNEPVRRGRVVGTDLLPELARTVPLDVFGMKVHELGEALDVPHQRLWTFEDLPQDRLHAEMARRRVYLHLTRWTSLGLSLIEAMHLGMPVVALATTEAVVAVPPGAGVVTTRLEEVAAALWRFVHDPAEAEAVGARAREAALARYGLARFLADWDALLGAAAARAA